MAEIGMNHADDGNRHRPRFGRTAMLLATVFVAAGVTALAIPAIRSASDAAPAPTLTVAAPVPTTSPAVPHPAPAGENFLCVENTAKPHCQRYVTDLTRRVYLDKSGHRAAQTALERMEAVMPPGRDGPCEYHDEDYDMCSSEILPPTPRQVSRALGKAGYRTAVVRVARADDPAPAGSVLFAVPIGRACVLSFDDGNGPASWTAGQLPDGGCLAP